MEPARAPTTPATHNTPTTPPAIATTPARPPRRTPRRSHRRWRLCRWGGLAAALLLALTDFASRPLYFFATPFSRLHLGLAKGGVRVHYREGIRVNDWGIEINGAGERNVWWFRVDRLRASDVDVAAPLWPFVGLSAASCALGWSHRRRERLGPTACPRCGYDLTGLSGPCPECGRPGRPAPQPPQPPPAPSAH